MKRTARRAIDRPEGRFIFNEGWGEMAERTAMRTESIERPRHGSRAAPWAWLPRSLGCLGLVLLCSAASAQAQIIIRFEPQPGTAFIERSRSTRTVEEAGKSAVTHTMVADTRYVIRADAQGGYTLTSTPLNPPDLRPDADTAAVLAGMISSMELHWDLDADGRLVRVRGLQAALSQLEPLKPLFDALLAALAQEGMTLTGYVERAWTDRGLFGTMTGWQVPLDTPLTRKVTQTFPGIGTVPLEMSLQFVGSIPCPAGQCVRARFKSVSRDPAVARGLARTMRQSMLNMLRAMAPDQDLSGSIPEFSFSNASIEVEDVRVFDPRTGLPYSQQVRRTVGGRMKVGDEADSGQFRTVDTQDYEFTYEPKR